MNPKPTALAAALLAAIHLPLAQAQGPSQASTAASNASAAISGASGFVVQGSMQALAASGQLAVAAIHVVGESTVLVLRGVSSAAEVSVQIASGVLQGVSLAVGTVVTVVAEVVGSALIVAGTLIAFIPNEVGRALVHQARLK